LLRNVVEVNPRAAIFPISCRTGQGMEGWIAWLMNELKSRRSEALSISKT